MTFKTQCRSTVCHDTMAMSQISCFLSDSSMVLWWKQASGRTVNLNLCDFNSRHGMLPAGNMCEEGQWHIYKVCLGAHSFSWKVTQQCLPCSRFRLQDSLCPRQSISSPECKQDIRDGRAFWKSEVINNPTSPTSPPVWLRPRVWPQHGVSPCPSAIPTAHPRAHLLAFFSDVIAEQTCAWKAHGDSPLSSFPTETKAVLPVRPYKELSQKLNILRGQSLWLEQILF